MTVRVLVSVVVALGTWLALRLAEVARDVVAHRWRQRPLGRRATGLGERAMAVVLGLGLATTTALAPRPVAAASTGGEHDQAPRPGGGAPQPATMRPLAPALAPPPPSAPVEPTWTIEPGDHLWGLSHAALAEAFARPPSDAEVAVYVAEVVDRNRHVLAVRGQPDLVFPGQVFVRPAVPSR